MVNLMRGMLCAVSLTMLFGGCGDSVSRQASSLRVSVAEAEHRCNVAYMRPRPKGEVLSFACGASGDTLGHYGAIYTRRVRCPVFITLVDSVGYRAQGCIGTAPRAPEGRVVCRGATAIVWARVLGRAHMVSVSLGRGSASVSNVLSLNAATRARWGGAYFEALHAWKPATAVLTERDREGRIVGRTSLFRSGACK